MAFVVGVSSSAKTDVYVSENAVMSAGEDIGDAEVEIVKDMSYESYAVVVAVVLIILAFALRSVKKTKKIVTKKRKPKKVIKKRKRK